MPYKYVNPSRNCADTTAPFSYMKTAKASKRTREDTQPKRGGTLDGAIQSQSTGENRGVSWKHFTWFHTLPSVKVKQSKSPFAQGNSGTEVII